MLQINFEKKEERWWDCLLKTEQKISVRKIDASRPMTDLDDEAQAKIEEMMYNDRRKKMGLPTSQEQVFKLLYLLALLFYCKASAIIFLGGQYPLQDVFSITTLSLNLCCCLVTIYFSGCFVSENLGE